MMRMHGAFALLLLGVSGAAGTNTHYDSTRIWSHSNVNYGSQAAHMGDPGTRGFKDPAQELLPKVKGDTQRAASGATLVQSITTVGVDGWSTAKANGNPSSVHLGADIGKGVVGSDTNGDSWYFLARATSLPATCRRHTMASSRLPWCTRKRLRVGPSNVSPT